MNISLAPMEGITTYIYRNLAASCFTAPDRFFTPYLSPAADRLFSERELTEVIPENNAGLYVVPQLMVNDASLCLAAIDRLQDMGYTEVNLNFGCPSGNVTRKKKGAGMLAHPDELNRLLDSIFSQASLPVSVKTRIGMHDPEEFEGLLTILRQYPLKELILHPRVRDEFYRGTLHMDCFDLACDSSPFPIVYNGEIHTREDIIHCEERYRNTAICRELMIGRGLIAAPDLLEPTPAAPVRIHHFHAMLEEEYRRLLPDETAVLVKMKRIMTWRMQILPHTREQRIRLLSADSLGSFHEAMKPFLQE